MFRWLVSAIAERVAERVTEEVILEVRKRSGIVEISKEAEDIKRELAQAESASEREAVLGKIHNLINGLDRI